MMSVGSPFSQYQLLKKRTVRSSAVMVIFVGTIQMSEFKRSVIMRMLLQPLSISRGPIKYIAINIP